MLSHLHVLNTNYIYLCIYTQHAHIYIFIFIYLFIAYIYIYIYIYAVRPISMCSELYFFNYYVTTRDSFGRKLKKNINFFFFCLSSTRLPRHGAAATVYCFHVSHIHLRSR
jgi:hypothetical protein